MATSNVIQLPAAITARVAATGVTLTRPRFEDIGASPAACYALRGGRVREIPLNRFQLPSDFRSALLVGPGDNNKDGLTWYNASASVTQVPGLGYTASVALYADDIDYSNDYLLGFSGKPGDLVDVRYLLNPVGARIGLVGFL